MTFTAPVHMRKANLDQKASRHRSNNYKLNCVLCNLQDLINNSTLARTPHTMPPPVSLGIDVTSTLPVPEFSTLNRFLECSTHRFLWKTEVQSCPSYSPCRIQETKGVGSAAAMHSITTLSPATTVVFSGAATMVTSPPAGWEPNVKNLKKNLSFQDAKFTGKKE